MSPWSWEKISAACFSASVFLGMPARIRPKADWRPDPAGRVTAQRVAELLKGDPRHAYEVASGRVGLAPSAWKRVLAELSIEEDRT